MQKHKLEFGGQAAAYMQCKTATLVHGGTSGWETWFRMKLKLPAPYRREITNIMYIEVQSDDETYSYNVEGDDDSMRHFVSDFGHIFNEAEQDDLVLCNELKWEQREWYGDEYPWVVEVHLEIPYDDASSTFINLHFKTDYWDGTRNAESLASKIRRLRAEIRECKARMCVAQEQQSSPDMLRALRARLGPHVKEAREELHQRLEERASRFLAISQSTHPRLGQDSQGFGNLSDDVIRNIARMSIHT